MSAVNRKANEPSFIPHPQVPVGLDEGLERFAADELPSTDGNMMDLGRVDEVVQRPARDAKVGCRFLD